MDLVGPLANLDNVESVRTGRSSTLRNGADLAQRGADTLYNSSSLFVESGFASSQCGPFSFNELDEVATIVDTAKGRVQRRYDVPV